MLGIAAALAVALPFLMGQMPLTLSLLLLSSASGLAVLFLVPVRWLPSVTLLAFALLPLQVLPGNRITGSFSPVLLTTVVWALRSSGQPRLRQWPKGISWFLGAWLIVSSVTSIAHIPSVLWATNFIVLVLVVAWLASKTEPMAIRLLERTWMALGAVLGALATVEHLLGRNPIPYLGTHYLITQEYWSVYRVTTTLGTPLVNGTFFAAAIVIAWVRLMARPSLFASVSFLAAGAGLVFSYTRGALLGAGVALAAVTLARLIRRGGDAGLKVITVLVVGAACFGGYQAIQVRAHSAEATYSTILRGRAVEASTTVAAEHHYLGSGPGTAHRALLAAGTAVPYYSSRGDIENSYLQLFVSTGVPGVAAVCSLIGVTMFWGWRRRAYGGLGALASVAVSAGGYNMAEAAVPALSLLGLTMLLCANDLVLLPRPRSIATGGNDPLGSGISTDVVTGGSQLAIANGSAGLP